MEGHGLSDLHPIRQALAPSRTFRGLAVPSLYGVVQPDPVIDFDCAISRAVVEAVFPLPSRLSLSQVKAQGREGAYPRQKAGLLAGCEATNPLKAAQPLTR